MRRKTRSILVRSAIMAAVAAVFVSNGVFYVKAEGNLEGVDALSSGDQNGADSQATEKTSDENNGQATESNQASADTAVAEAESAQANSEQVQEMVSNLAENVESMAKDVETVQSAVENAQTVASDVDEEISGAKEQGDTAVKALQEESKNALDVLQETAENVQSAIDDLNDKAEDTVVTVTNEDGTDSCDIVIGNKENAEGETEEILLNEYMQEQADVATEQAQKAKDSLENALADGNDIPADKLQEYVDTAKAAADEVNKVKTEAENNYNNAKNQVLNEVKEYNAYAAAYGYPLIEFEGTTPQYTVAEMAGKGVELANTSENVAKVGETINQITEQLNEVEKAKESLETAKAACEEIQKSAEDALSAASQAAALVDESAQNAKDAVSEDVDSTVASGVVSAAEQASSNASEVLSNAETVVDDLKEKISDTEKDISSADDTLNTVAATADAAIQELTYAVKQYRPDMTELQNTISKKILALNAANGKLTTIKNKVYGSKNFVDWLNALNSQQTTRVYGQLKLDGSGIADENSQKFDESDDDVESHRVVKFKEVTSGGKPVEVPYAVYRSYVETMHDRKDDNGRTITYKDVMNHKADGLGAAINSESKMPEIYWAVDDNGNIIGDPFLKNVGDDVPRSVKTGEPMPEGRYFMGYTFKYEADSFYHIDGYMVNYKLQEEPTTPDVPPAPEPITPEPITPEPITPEPITPEPITPEPPTPEPITPEPITPEPTTPEPPTPEPTTPEPTTPEPTTPDEPGNPVSSTTDDNTNVVNNNTESVASANTSGNTVALADEPTPLAASPATVTIGDDIVPLASGTENAGVTIDDEAIPLAASPATGDDTKAKWPWAAAGTGLIAAAGIVNVFSRKRKIK